MKYIKLTYSEEEYLEWISADNNLLVCFYDDDVQDPPYVNYYGLTGVFDRTTFDDDNVYK